MSESFLSQEEIDALLKGNNLPQEDVPPETPSEAGESQEPQAAPETAAPYEEELSQDEMDVIGEVGNISMGSAATTLSDLVNNRVSITTPQISMSTQKELFSSFVKPYVVIKISYTAGLSGTNLLLISTTDANIIADLMMGGTGKDVAHEFGELQLSAVSEAMNQMMGSAATSMSSMFDFKVNITPPLSDAIDFEGKTEFESGLDEERIVVVSFRLVVGDLIDSQLMQVIPIDGAKDMVKHLLSSSFPEAEEEAGEKEYPGESTEPAEEIYPVHKAQEEDTLYVTPDYRPDAVTLEHVHQDQHLHDLHEIPESRNLDLILDVPLRVSVVLGRCKRPVGEVLKLVPGTIVELDSMSSEPVDILVNGTLIAQGEVVVVNENFGIQVKNIISPEERLRRLRE